MCMHLVARLLYANKAISAYLTHCQIRRRFIYLVISHIHEALSNNNMLNYYAVIILRLL